MIEDLPCKPPLKSLSLLFQLDEAISGLTNGKAPGGHCLLPKEFKYGGPFLVERLHHLYSIIWHSKEVPQDFKEAKIIHLYKRKGEHADYNDHRGISLLCTAGKVRARVIVSMVLVLADGTNPEGQRGSRENRGTAELLFSSAREKQRATVRPI